MPRTRSRWTLAERRERAFEYFSKGLNVSQVARKLDVTWDTAKSYRERWQEDLSKRARSNPQLLQDVVKNTLQSLEQIDFALAEAWKTYHQCSDYDTGLKAIGHVRSLLQDRSRLLGLMGVKQEMWNLVASVKDVQDRLLDFMQAELCPSDREKLIRFLSGAEFERYMNTNLPVLEIESVSDVVDAELVE